MTVMNEIELKRDEIERIAKENGITKISIFGSVARGNVHGDSDIDFLIEIEEDRSLFDIIRFKQAMEELFQRKVDVLTENAVHWTLRDQIIKEAIPL